MSEVVETVTDAESATERSTRRGLRGSRMLVVCVAAQSVQFVQQLCAYLQVTRLNRPLPRVHGLSRLLTPEWLTLAWLWLVVAALVTVRRRIGPNRWLTVALAWTLLHSLEHFYLLVQFARVTTAVDNFGLPRPRSLDLLPGVFGHDGWIAVHVGLLRPWLGALLSAPRVTIHLWWSTGDLVVILAVLVHHSAGRHRGRQRANGPVKATRLR